MPPSSGASSPPLSPPRRSARLAAQAQRSAADSASFSDNISPESVGEQFGLAGLTVLPIPAIDDIATIHTHAKERRAQLDQGTSTQNTLIYLVSLTLAIFDVLGAQGPPSQRRTVRLFCVRSGPA